MVFDVVVNLDNFKSVITGLIYGIISFSIVSLPVNFLLSIQLTSNIPLSTASIALSSVILLWLPLTTFTLNIVALFLAVAVIFTFAFETYLISLLLSPVRAIETGLISSTVAVTVGSLSTIKALNVQVSVPINVVSLYVWQVIVPSPTFAFGILAKNDVGIVQPILVSFVFVAIVPVNPAKLYVSVCVNDELALLIFIVVLLPMFPSSQVTVEALGIVVRVLLVLAVKTPPW